MSKNQSIVKYGMHVVGKSLEYIRRGDFQGLIDLIHRRIFEKEEINFLKFESSGETIREILKKSAERLGNSSYLVDRLLDGAKVYRFLGMEDEARKLEEKYGELEEKYRLTYDLWYEKLAENQPLTF